jgi:hypothetical protein
MNKWLLMVLLTLASCSEEKPFSVVVVKKDLTSVMVRKADGQECILYLTPSVYNACKPGDVIICRSTVLGIKPIQ